MNTQLSSDKEQEQDPTLLQDPPNILPKDATLTTSFNPPSEPPLSPSQPTYYYQEEEEIEGDRNHEISAPFVVPFQLSSAIPVQDPHQAGQKIPSAPLLARKPLHKARFIKILLVVLVIALVLGILWFSIFAQPGQAFVTTKSIPPPSITHQAASNSASHQSASHQVVPPAVPSVIVKPAQPATPAGGGTWIPQQLPAEWTNAGLSTSDALYAERTAWAFTDREEGLDFRNTGTRARHGGTLTAATFILTPAAKGRFNNNDVRAINNTLFDRIQATRLIQTAVNAVPTLIKFQTQGQTNYAWVDVAYQLYQSQIDPNNQQHREGLENDVATGKPFLHHMSVLLVRVIPGSQGMNAPMGGTGWLVSNYSLDQPNNVPVESVQPA